MTQLNAKLSLLAFSLLLGCGNGDTEHEVYVHGETEHTVTVQIAVDISHCEELEDDEEKDQCILDAQETAKQIAEALANQTYGEEE